MTTTDLLQHNRESWNAESQGGESAVLAAAGGIVTSFDLSDEPIAKAEYVAKREGFALQCVRGDMTDLSAFGSDTTWPCPYSRQGRLLWNCIPPWTGIRRGRIPGTRLMSSREAAP
jgi:hypothetical protein